jgi:Putative MetA-pathway of phenol degradation
MPLHVRNALKARFRADSSLSLTEHIGETFRHVRFLLAARFFFAALAVISLGPSAARAQTVDPQPVISTDRPSVANSSIVVPKGYFQVENGMLITRTQGDTILDLPETSLRFGLLERTELRFSVPDYFQTLSGGSLAGLGDIAVGVKQQLGPTRDNFNFAAIIFLSLPTGAKAISSHGYDPGLQLPWSRALSTNWTASGQAAFYWPTLGDRRNFTTEVTFVLDRQLTRPWDVFVEYAGDFPDHTGSRQILHFGSSYKLSARQQLDFQVAAGLSSAAPDAYFGVGYSFLLHAVK